MKPALLLISLLSAGNPAGAHAGCAGPEIYSGSITAVTLLESAESLLRPDSLFHLARPVMGTTAEIYLYAENQERASEFFEAAFSEMEEAEAALSSYRPASEVSRINREAGAGPVTTDPEVFHIIRTAFTLSEKTGGTFDITVGPLMKAWGFFRETGKYPSPVDLAEARANTGWDKVVLDEKARTIRFLTPDLEMDLGGIGKGWALDRAAARLQRLGVEAALLGLGQSSFFAIGAPPGTRGWPITVPDPDSQGEALSTITLRDRSLSTSGNTQKYFVLDGKRYGHIIDPRTGHPAEGITQVTVTAPTTAESDALSTALFVMGPRGAEAFLNGAAGVQAFIVLGGGRDRRLIPIDWPGPARDR